MKDITGRDVFLYASDNPNVPIHLDQSKALRISESHPEIGNFIFWAIPEILNDPIVIAESKDNSSVVYGEASYNGHPLSVVLRIKSTQRGNASIETCKVRSSYLMKDSDLQKVFGENGSRVVDLNENKMGRCMGASDYAATINCMHVYNYACILRCGVL